VHSPSCVEQMRRGFPAHWGTTHVVPIGATESHDWARAADAYEEIVERTAAGRTVPQAERTSSLQCPQLVATPAWLQAAT
jgi:hypothetical protein